MANLADNAKLVATAMVLADRPEATLSQIYDAVREINPQWRTQYKDEGSFRATIRNTIECYCPQSENWRPEREALFERIRRGRYRAVPVAERPAVIARGRSLARRHA